LAHRIVRRGVSQSQRRKKSWGAFAVINSPAGVVSPTIALTTLDLSGLASPAEDVLGAVFNPTGIPAESTLLRIRGSLLVEKNSQSVTTLFTLAYGIGVMESGAALQGAFPNPASPAGANWDGWMFYRSINTSILDAEAAIIDVKSMRKIESGYSLFFAYGAYAMTTDDATIGSVAAASTSLITARGLFLLP